MKPPRVSWSIALLVVIFFCVTCISAVTSKAKSAPKDEVIITTLNGTEDIIDTPSKPKAVAKSGRKSPLASQARDKLTPETKPKARKAPAPKRVNAKGNKKVGNKQQRRKPNQRARPSPTASYVPAKTDQKALKGKKKTTTIAPTNEEDYPADEQDPNENNAQSQDNDYMYETERRPQNPRKKGRKPPPKVIVIVRGQGPRQNFPSLQTTPMPGIYPPFNPFFKYGTPPPYTNGYEQQNWQAYRTTLPPGYYSNDYLDGNSHQYAESTSYYPSWTSYNPFIKHGSTQHYHWMTPPPTTNGYEDNGMQNWRTYQTTLHPSYYSNGYYSGDYFTETTNNYNYPSWQTEDNQNRNYPYETSTYYNPYYWNNTTSNNYYQFWTTYYPNYNWTKFYGANADTGSSGFYDYTTMPRYWNNNASPYDYMTQYYGNQVYHNTSLPQYFPNYNWTSIYGQYTSGNPYYWTSAGSYNRTTRAPYQYSGSNFSEPMFKNSTDTTPEPSSSYTAHKVLFNITG